MFLLWSLLADFRVLSTDDHPLLYFKLVPLCVRKLGTIPMKVWKSLAENVMTALLKQLADISASSIHLSAAFGRSRSTNIRAQTPYMTTPTLHRAAEPYQSHGDLINPDHALLLMYLCTDHVRQSGPGLFFLFTSSQLYATSPKKTASPAHSLTFVATS